MPSENRKKVLERAKAMVLDRLANRLCEDLWQTRRRQLANKLNLPDEMRALVKNKL